MRARDRRCPRLHPVAVDRHVQPRAADAAHVRRDAAARHRRLHLADRPPLGELGRRLGSRLPCRALGRDRRESSARASTTTSRAGTRIRRSTSTGGASRRSGTAGSAIWGAIPFGVLAGAIVVHRSGNSVRLMMDAVAPGLLLAQGIGRWGNYWNQELYGKPTSLPWGLKIDQVHQSGIVARYQGAAATTSRPSSTSSSGT